MLTDLDRASGWRQRWVFGKEHHLFIEGLFEARIWRIAGTRKWRSSECGIAAFNEPESAKRYTERAILERARVVVSALGKEP